MRRGVIEGGGRVLWRAVLCRVVLCGVVLSSAALIGGCQADPHRLSVVFPEAGGLKPGDNVSIRGLAVGQVIDVDLHPEGVVAAVEINPRYRAHVDSGARFRIDTEKLVTGKMTLVVVPGDPLGAPLPVGAIVEGEPPPPDPVTAAKAALTETVDHARDQAKGLGRAMLNPDQLPPRAAGDTVDLDRPGEHRVVLHAIKVEETSADGSAWDTASDPDLVVQVWAGPRQVLLAEADDTLEIKWPEGLPTRRFALDGDLAVRLKVLDADTTMNDEIGVVELRPTVDDARMKRRFRLTAGRVAEAVLSIEPAPADEAAPAPPPGAGEAKAPSAPDD